MQKQSRSCSCQQAIEWLHDFTRRFGATRPFILRGLILFVGTVAGWSTVFANVQPTNETRVVSNNPMDYDYFADNVAISSNSYTIVAGTPGKDSGIQTNAGVAEVFTYNGSSWDWQATLQPSVPQGYAYFGISTAISEDGNRVVIGASDEDGIGGTDAGAAYLYSRTGSTWGSPMRLQGHDTQAYDYFGEGVGLSGNTIVVGADGAEVGSGVYPGAAYVFLVSTGGVVTEQAKLSSSDGEEYDWFGWSVAIDGDTIVVGAPGDDDGAADAGSAYVFERTGTNWTQTSKLTSANPAATNYFGTFLSIDGDTIVVGDYLRDGAGPNIEAGAVDVFVRDGTNWTRQATLEASDPQSYAWYGFAIDVNGDVISVGAPYYSSVSLDWIGQTYLYQRHGTNWTETARFSPGGVAYDDESGWDVSLCNDRVVTVANNEAVAGHLNAGAMYVYDLLYSSIAPPVITWIGLTNTVDVALRFTSEAGAIYRVDYRDSLTAGGWLELSNNIPGTGSEVMITDWESPVVTSRFYQVVSP